MGRSGWHCGGQKPKLSLPVREEECGERLTRKWRDFSIPPSLSIFPFLAWIYCPSFSYMSLPSEAVTEPSLLYFSSWCLTDYLTYLCILLSCVSVPLSLPSSPRKFREGPVLRIMLPQCLAHRVDAQQILLKERIKGWRRRKETLRGGATLRKKTEIWQWRVVLILIWDSRKLSVLKEFTNAHHLKNYGCPSLVCWKGFRQCYLEIQS